MGRCLARAAMVGMVLLLAGGCVVTRKLLVDSIPQNADVYVDGNLVGQTPYDGKVAYNSPEHRIIVQVVKPGHNPERQVCRQDERRHNVFINLRPLPGE